jgi:hypothetical protein
MGTPYTRSNHDFSRKAQRYAIDEFYRPFGFKSILTDPKGEGWADQYIGVDCVGITAKGTAATIQERWRRKKYAHYRELTATDSNDGTGRKGDFHKLQADLYAYGYYDAQNEEIIEALLVSVPSLKSFYDENDVETKFYWQKKQTILLFPFDDLNEYGAILARYAGRKLTRNEDAIEAFNAERGGG